LRFSKLAPRGSSARLDVVAPWPVAVRDWPDLPDEPARTALPNSRLYAGELPGGRYLTSVRLTSGPSSPDTDPRFVRAPRDDYRRTIYEDETIVLAPYIALAVSLGFLAGGAIAFVRRRRERSWAVGEPVIDAVVRTLARGDRDELERLLHPYVHWTTAAGETIRGRRKVLAHLADHREGQAPRSFELRDGQVYRWGP
jgi:hypothetical protein